MRILLRSLLPCCTLLILLANCWHYRSTRGFALRSSSSLAGRRHQQGQRLQNFKGSRQAGSAEQRESPQEFLDSLVESGALEGREDLLKELKRLVASGVHPLDVLQGLPREEAPGAALLRSFDMAGVAEYIKEKGCKNIVVMCGAGISTAAGIPDFRSPGSGLYDNLQRFNLSRPEMIFELDFFREQPEAFYELCREIWPGNYNPTTTHYFIKLLNDKGLLRRCYTQNIDSLERLAGLPADKLVAAHGNFDEAHVIDTFPEELVDINDAKEGIVAGEKGWKALREKWGNLVKPKIVFFGESLPQRFFQLAGEDLQECDLLIVLGTSLLVMPFAGLVGMASQSAPRLLINRDPVGTFDRLQGGFRYHLPAEQNGRDVWYKGTCDGGSQELAEALGWGEDLIELEKGGPVSTSTTTM
mmetsp:Transcript_25338/g.58886  ORF Transcript_25338/g.58886 Transcript_25338/m.58886 type:complete len:415 (+) Transcript_25338:51-1295(+)